MGIALGQEPPVGLYIAGRLHTGYYDDIPDVSVDPDDIETLWDDEFGPEKFIDLSERVDVLVMDPNFLTGRADWSGDAIERIKSTGTPFFGNSITSRGYSWHQDYDYLTMYEAFEKLAEVFQEQERYDEFETLHDEFQSELENVVPSSGRPEAAVLYPQIADDSFLPTSSTSRRVTNTCGTSESRTRSRTPTSRTSTTPADRSTTRRSSMSIRSTSCFAPSSTSARRSSSRTSSNRCKATTPGRN